MTFVAVSRSLALQWREIGIDALVIGNGIDLARFAYRSRPDPEPFVLWTGRLVPEKGLHLVIKAARIVEIELRFAGKRNDPAYWAAEIAPRLGDATYLCHLGHAALSDVLEKASVLVCSPRWEEPFGLVVAEALACGTPVAAFARGAMPDILDASCGRLATPDDVDELSAAIIGCLTLDRRHCRSRAEDLSDADTMSDRYEAVYRRMISAGYEAALFDLSRTELSGAGAAESTAALGKINTH